MFFSSVSICTHYSIEVIFYSVPEKKNWNKAKVHVVENQLDQHEVYEQSSYLQPRDDGRTVPLCERQSFPPRLLQQLMPREKRQTDKWGEGGREGGSGRKSEETSSAVLVDKQRDYLSLLSLAARPSLPSRPLIRTNTPFF